MSCRATCSHPHLHCARSPAKTAACLIYTPSTRQRSEECTCVRPASVLGLNAGLRRKASHKRRRHVEPDLPLHERGASRCGLSGRRADQPSHPLEDYFALLRTRPRTHSLIDFSHQSAIAAIPSTMLPVKRLDMMFASLIPHTAATVYR